MPLIAFPLSSLLVFTGLLGLVFGSFLNVVIYRLPRGQNLAYPPSTCPNCGKPIEARDNVPVFGWLLLRGRSRCCKDPISARYPLIELCGLGLAWAVLCFRVLPADPELGEALLRFVLQFFLALGLLAMAAIDWEFMILPDSLTLGGAGLGLVASYLTAPDELLWHGGAAVFGFLLVYLPFIKLYELLRGRPGMGLGDAKLLALAGAWFGLPGVFFTLFGGALQGSVVALVILIFRGKIAEPEAVKLEREELRLAIEAAEGEEREELQRELDQDPLGDDPSETWRGARIAFGPFLALACLEYLLFEPALRLFWLAEFAL